MIRGAIEKILAVRKEWGSAPRAGVALAVQPGLDYAVERIYNEREETTNGIVQTITIDLPGRRRVTGTYHTYPSPSSFLVDRWL